MDDELERIDYVIYHEKLTDDNFAYTRRGLESILSENENDVNAIIRYTKLIMKKNNRDFLYAGNLLERAMQAEPLNETIYGLYASVRECRVPVFLSSCDWFIRTCEPYARQYPSNMTLMKMLIEVTIERKYFEKALELIKLLPCDEQAGSLQNLLRGDVEYAKGNAEIVGRFICACVSVSETRQRRGRYPHMAEDN